jgi:predicted secreted protein
MDENENERPLDQQVREALARLLDTPSAQEQRKREQLAEDFNRRLRRDPTVIYSREDDTR